MRLFKVGSLFSLFKSLGEFVLVQKEGLKIDYVDR